LTLRSSFPAREKGAQMNTTHVAYHATYLNPHADESDLYGIAYERQSNLYYFLPDDCEDGFLVTRAQVHLHGQVQMVAGLYPGLPGGVA
jgi:hypothetical protein